MLPTSPIWANPRKIKYKQHSMQQLLNTKVEMQSVPNAMTKMKVNQYFRFLRQSMALKVIHVPQLANHVMEKVRTTSKILVGNRLVQRLTFASEVREGQRALTL
jgi:hypothetical protein